MFGAARSEALLGFRLTVKQNVLVDLGHTIVSDALRRRP